MSLSHYAFLAFLREVISCFLEHIGLEKINLGMNQSEQSGSNSSGSGNPSGYSGADGNTETPSGSDATSTNIPITREEKETLSSYLKDLKESVEGYERAKNLRDHYANEHAAPLADFMQTMMDPSEQVIRTKYDKASDYKNYLLNDKYGRSDEVNDYIESLDPTSEDKALDILEEF